MEKYNDLTFEMLPASWIFCFLDECPQAEECLRRISSRTIPGDMSFGRAIYPTVLQHGHCEYFKSAEKMQCAYGFKTLFREVKIRDEGSLRDELKNYLGSRAAYYRYHNGERLLTPVQQQWIINLFKRFGYTENLRFDHYCEVYYVE